MSKPSAHFREDLSDKRGAERVLVGQPLRSYVTWRVGTSDDKFMLTYISESFNGDTIHVDLTRLSDGSFRCTMGHDATTFATLGDFVASRKYIAPDVAVRTLSSSSSSTAAAAALSGGGLERSQSSESSAGDSASALGGSTGGLRHRTVPPAATGPIAPIGGRADVPTDVPLPAPKYRGGAGGGDTIVPPTFSHRTFNYLFLAVGAIAIALGASVAMEYRTHEARAKNEAALITSVVEGYVHDANAALWVSLPSAIAASSSLSTPSHDGADDGSAGAAEDGVVAAACAGVVKRWRATIAQAVPEAQAIFEAGEAPPYLRHLIALTFGGLFGCWLLTCVSTGRTIPSDAPVDASVVDHDPDAANASINDGRGRPPPCTAMQAKWIFAFSALLAASVLAGVTGFHAMWDYGDAAKAVEYAAKPLSSRHSWHDKNASAREAVWARARARASSALQHVEGARPIGWSAGDFASALHAVRAPPACAAAIHPLVEPLVSMAPVLRVPLDNILPLPMQWAVHGVLAARRQWVARVRSSQQQQQLLDKSIPRDAFSLDDPMAGTAVSGWLDAGGAYMVMPSNAGISFLVIEVMFYTLMSFVITTLTSDWLASAIPAWRSSWAWRRKQAARKASAVRLHTE